MLHRIFTLFFLAAFLFLSGIAAAHTPLFACFDNADGTVYCEGGFSDGSSAAGIPIIVKDGSGNVIQTLELSRNSDVEFDKPEGEYSVLFDGGEGHDILIPGSQIFE
ncbi:hypothetical protein SAMN05660653_02005 [Desulfonatronum thiosulfatophilum]|uniref:Nickel transport protein n=1 Tax=Desulfonatronum thiosulfatophilum TaxID=617002 RepID=A0A1G6D8G8_9BACT|nr:hypothetical protein [Desulfonatronum thiosulfatophilum]SDB41442.1 hypothetical protein SAMN05660653_02005 [Desulfonatronum thiosulfatophilum]